MRPLVNLKDSGCRLAMALPVRWRWKSGGFDYNDDGSIIAENVAGLDQPDSQSIGFVAT